MYTKYIKFHIVWSSIHVRIVNHVNAVYREIQQYIGVCLDE